MPTPNAALAGHFSLGGDLKVNRMGFGAMRITGRGIWGPPADKAECIRTLKRLADLGVNFIDTAEAYGPFVSEELIREALHPYGDIVVATKGGLQRSGPDHWDMNGLPDVLRRGLEGSLKRLGLEQIPLWQLHRIDPRVPRKEQFDAIQQFRKEGLVKHVGLSEVGVTDIEEAQVYFPVVSVQNRYSPAARGSDAVLEYCESHSIGFIPWAPLASGALASGAATLEKIAAKYSATTGQIALAWLLKRSPVMLPIPGTGKVAHLDENVAAATIALSGEDEALIANSQH
jgi:pyridoxine 4-dehydrogenase